METNAVCEARTNKIHEEINLLRQTTNANALILARVDKSLHGNGKKGLIEQYSENKWRTWIAIILIGSSGASGGVAFFGILRSLLL